MNNAGWYPDPGGQPGLFRYWDGYNWTTAVSSNPQGEQGAQQGYLGQPNQSTQSQYPGISQPLTPGSQPIRPSDYGQSAYGVSDYGSNQQYQYGSGAPYDQGGYQEQSGSSGKAWWVVFGVAVVAIAVLIWFVVSNIPQFLPGGEDSSGRPTQNICPQIPTDNENPPRPKVENGRVYGGKLSYQQLGAPWGEVSVDNRVAYNSIAATQIVIDQYGYSNENGQISSWVSSVLVSELFIGDGFASTQQGAETLMKCVLGEFYSDQEIGRNDISSEAFPVSGHDGWQIASHLEFSIPGLIATSEEVNLIVVQTSTSEYSLFYSSVPNTSQQLLPDVQSAIDSLEVSD